MEGPMFSSSLGAMRSLLGKLRSLLVSAEDQVPEPLNSQKDKLDLLKQDLEEINTFLMNLSWVEAPNMMVRHWMNEVRDLSYDIEDYIDKRMHPSPDSSEESRSEPEVEELSTLVKQAKDALERHNRYDLGCWASNPSPRFVIHGGQGPVRRLNRDATDPVGIDDSMGELIKRLNIDAEQRLVVAIQGPAGVGKTTLAQEVYREMEGRFECRAFVRASKMPDTRRLLRSIISQLQLHHQRLSHGLPVQELIDILRTQLLQKRYLIVIDGLWETTSWDIVSSAFPDDTHCSRILITTDIEEVALECCDYESDAIFKMEPLGRNYCTELFFNRVFGFKHECSKQLKENSEEIIRMCDGLPLAIICIASILAIQPDNLELWRHVKEALFSRLRYNLTFEVMLREIVGLSYNSLPHHLKTCLLYLTMYPEGYTFLKADLVKQWSAEGFIIAVEEKNCDEVAECYFEELISRGLIHPNHTNISAEVILYTLHSTVFEVIRSMSNEENFSTVIDYSNTISELSVKVRRLSLRFSSAKYATKPETIALSPVRSLIFYGLVECLPSIMEFEVLRVLILDVWGDHDQEELDLSGIDRLFQLRYMRITSNIIVKLPARLIGLPFLQTMEIFAKVTSVPSDIIHLPRLVHLCVRGEINLSKGIGHMGSLRTLQSFDISSNSEDNIWQLGEMTNLRDLHVISPTEMSDSLKRKLIAFVSSLEKLGNLKSITLAPVPSCKSIYLDCSSSPSSMSVFLQRLELLPPFCIFSRLPVWIGQLQMLCILKIVLRELTTGDVDSIAKLQELTILSLYVRQPIAEHIVFHCAAFPVLKCFKFRCGIMRIAFQPDAMPNLRRLKLEFNAHTGEQNGNMLDGIEHLINLQEITGGIGATPGSEESDRIAVESVFKDAISKHSRLTNFNLRIVGLFDEEWHKNCELDEVAAVVEVTQSNDASSTPNQVFSTPFQAISDRQSWDDGYNWRKYGLKPVKGNQYQRSYYRCTFPSCPAKRRVDRSSQDGQITEIVYKGKHNHVRWPQLWQSGGNEAFVEHMSSVMSTMTTVTTSSIGSNEIGVSSLRVGNSSGDEFDEQEADSKTWIRFDDAPASSSGSDEELDRHSMAGCSSKLDEVAAVVEEVSESNDASSTPSMDRRRSDDGYNWRKYGQKQVKGSDNMRIYYKCTFPSCPVKKKVERSQDGQITEIVYRGRHNHAKPTHKAPQALQSDDASEHSLGGMSGTSVVTVEGLLAPIADDDVRVSWRRWRAENAGGDEFEKDQPDSKRRKDTDDGELISMRPGGLLTQLFVMADRARCRLDLTLPMPQPEVATSLDVPLPLPPVPVSVEGSTPTPPGFPTPAAATAQLQPPPHHAELERVGCIGSGAGSTVWMVRDRSTGRFYALKVLYGNHDYAVRGQIASEIAIFRTAEHPAVLRCHGMYEHGGELQILLEYMDGGSLDGCCIDDEPFLADIARQVLSGIAYLHRRHIVHCGIKPSNLLIDSARRVKIANFGVGRILNQTSTVDPSNSTVGTIAYMSPELINTDLKDGSYDGYAGDIWSFGLSILELYLGRFPFGENLGKQGDWAKLMCAICYSDSPEPPSTASPEFRGFISCCLHKNPAKRPTAAQLLQHPFVVGPQPQRLADPPSS